MRILSNLKYDRTVHGSFHLNSGEQVTIPEDTLSMREIYNRFRNGEPLDLNLYDPHYSDDEYQDIDVSMLDPVEVMELTQHYNDIRKAHEEKLEREQEKERAKKQVEEFYQSLGVETDKQ